MTARARANGVPSLPPLLIPPRKHADFEEPPSLTRGGGGGNLSPNLQPNTPPVLQTGNYSNECTCQTVGQIAEYLLFEQLDAVGSIHIYRSLHKQTKEEFVCKVLPLAGYRETLSAYWLVNSHDHINQIEEILLGQTQAYVFFARHYGDLHSYVRNKRKLKEPEAIRLFHQAASAVAYCHENGVVLRDLKLRKFVFKDEAKTELKLEGLEDACVLDDDQDDHLDDKHGCPAYVSPEILMTSDGYSGKAADVWSLGVMLYTMLIGRYPFHDVEPSVLFTKIRRGNYSVPDTVSSRAKCLIRSLLRRSPSERLTAEEILQHPWFRATSGVVLKHKSDKKEMDQTVPNVKLEDTESFFF